MIIQKHNIGDMVASYTTKDLDTVVVGWISEVVYETIWIAHVEDKELKYKIEWADDSEDALFLHSNEDIDDMKLLYNEWHREKQ